MKLIQRFVPPHISFLIIVHLILLGTYSLFRYITLVYNRPSYFFQAERSKPVWEAFWIGFKFDVTIASYAIILPFLLLVFAFFWPKYDEKIFKMVRVYCGAIVLISLLICAADIPYFNFFNSRLTTAAVNWKNLMQVVKYLATEYKYYPFIAISFFFIWGIGKFMRYLWRRAWVEHDPSLRTKLSSVSLASLLMLYGIWGGATPRRLDMKSATFSNDGFINQLTLNPVHTWFDSYFDFDINIFPLEKAIKKVQQDFGVSKALEESPIAQQRHFTEKERNMNVVLVLLESMSAHRMGIFGNRQNLTPNLDQLCRNSVFFDRCYSNGIHTNAGLYSTIYGMPIMMMQHPMMNGLSEHNEFNGLPMTLKKLGYSTSFFCTHPKTFDNLDVFLNKNGYDRIIDMYDYPKETVANSWGVGDETLFDFGFQYMDSLANANGEQPFFTTLLTITTHPPFTLPAFTKFKPTKQDPIEITYEYTDWALKNFMDSCATKPWYNNTIFVFVGDHGVNLPSQYDVPLSYNHVPLIIHAPGIFKKPEQRHDLANQTDIFPTIMGLLRKDYLQNSLGYDLFREKRPFAIFSQDHKLGVINDKYLYVARKSGSETLFDLDIPYCKDVKKNNAALVDSMRNYACAQLMVAQKMIRDKQTK